ncbi:DUF1697 domain-containing protein [Nocardioides sp.]|uniref:DUF1697 domain-containing protein n=1 Tax=Nocardioides sp. TaxID=35761 RepID=UPI0026100C52|nr:DUF1697 domain-containing protein [Nocardioides sp.]
MTTYVSLIRGIGPGDPKKSNESLRGVHTDLGFGDVRSVISSGNVIFSSDQTDPDALGEQITAAWPEQRGFSALTIVRSAEQIAHLLEQRPFGDVEHSKATYQLVTFFATPLREVPPIPQSPAVTVVGIVDGALCTQHDTTTTKGPDVMVWLDRTYRKQTTSRTPLTLQRILTRMQAG